MKFIERFENIEGDFWWIPTVGSTIADSSLELWIFFLWIDQSRVSILEVRPNIVQLLSYTYGSRSYNFIDLIVRKYTVIFVYDVTFSHSWTYYIIYI